MAGCENASRECNNKTADNKYAIQPDNLVKTIYTERIYYEEEWEEEGYKIILLL